MLFFPSCAVGVCLTRFISVDRKHNGSILGVLFVYFKQQGGKAHKELQLSSTILLIRQTYVGPGGIYLSLGLGCCELWFKLFSFAYPG